MAIKDVEGADEFQAATGKIIRAMPESMRIAALDFARQWVALAQQRTYDKFSQEASAAFIVANSGDGAEITNSSPVFFGSEFGGQARPETMQFPPWNGREGYWFYPARRANEDQLAEIWGKGIDVAMSPWDRSG